MKTKADYFIKIKDVKKLLNNTESEFNDSNYEYFHGMAERGEIEARAAEAYVGMYASAINTYKKIALKLLKNLEDYKRSENENL